MDLQRHVTLRNNELIKEDSKVEIYIMLSIRGIEEKGKKSVQSDAIFQVVASTREEDAVGSLNFLMGQEC